MSQYGLPSSRGVGDGDGAGRERGGRRQKVYGYLKAANELRQTYTSQLATQINTSSRDYSDEFYDTPGAFPDVEIARSGDEEMVIFPSYARKLSQKRLAERIARHRRDSESSIDEYGRESDDLESRGIDLEEYEMENAVVAVDVRGWLYSPHRGPMTRKHRLMISLARRLSGVPAPSSYAPDNAGSSADVGSDKITSQREDELVKKEMQSMINEAESGADAAWKSSARDSGRDEEAPPERPPAQTAATEPVQLSKDELSMANAHLMERLRPFLANPMVEMPVTVFFFNDEQSQSRSIMTDASGHFTLRAALPFNPTHIRVLASENLSAAKEIQVVEPSGVSLISDIDDTVKHSAIANGAKEMFRNTFVRELSELMVDGVSSWYTKLAQMGVGIHYVSNAPWQLYPLLDRFFKLVGLPPGSFHLKQYSGMLQGIFEPTAERKRASLERILEDFPERKFILVGDSGEADLEVYTGVVLENPGRILGIFIRDVTTTDHALFFEKSVDHLKSGLPRSRSTGQLVHDDPDATVNRPVLPPRRPTEQAASCVNDAKSIDNGDLIDLWEEGEEPKKPDTARPLPAKPSKPSALRTVSTNPDTTQAKESTLPSSQDGVRRKPAPPIPPRRSNPSSTDGATEQNPSTESYATAVINAVSNVSNSLPAAADYLPLRSRPPGQNPGQVPTGESAAQPKQAPPPPPPRRTNTGSLTSASQSNVNLAAPPPISQRQQQSYPAAALQYASDRLWPPTPTNVLRPAPSNPSLGRSSNNSVNELDGYNSSGPPTPLPNKREELWRRRWERASEVLEQNGVVLGSWRVGGDVQDVCVWLAKKAMREMRGSK